MAREATIIGHGSATATAIGFALFVVVSTILVVMLVRLYQRRRVHAPLLRSPTLAADATAAAKRQIAAVPVRRGSHGEIEVLVISTRGSGRWTVPKGWPMNGRSDAEAAAQEAFEEAGVRGIIATEPIGTANAPLQRPVPGPQPTRDADRNRLPARRHAPGSPMARAGTA